MSIQSASCHKIETWSLQKPIVVAACVDVVKKTGDGKLKYLVNNAGLGIVAPILDTNIDEGRKMFEVNYWGALAMIQAFVPFIKEAEGTITNVGSGAANVTIPWIGMFFLPFSNANSLC